tara:strand:+ start:168 stop:281 length:114 start_codon:yes stop_codon:yes gene_type:complete
MDNLLPLFFGIACGVLALIGFREFLKELFSAASSKVG